MTGPSATPSGSSVVHDADHHRFVISDDGAEAELVYRRHGNRFVLVHTGVPPELEGKGIGGALVEAAVREASADGLTVVPLCPFARGWLERHPEVAGTARIDWHEASDKDQG